MTWPDMGIALQKLGGTPETIYVRKTGLPFFDAQRLYGAIDQVFGLNGDTKIIDDGMCWKIIGNTRKINNEKLCHHIGHVRSGISPKPKGKSDEIAEQLRNSLRTPNRSVPIADITKHRGTGSFSGLDSVLQSGVRGTSAASYDTLQSGNTGARECQVEIELFDGILAAAGAARTESVGDLVFLPVFEGEIDFSKIVVPLRAWLKIPSPLCAQALLLLALETSLLAEGYRDRLSAIVYNRRVQQGEFAYSGVLSVEQTALANSGALDRKTVDQLYTVFRQCCLKAWEGGKSTSMYQPALVLAQWIIHPHVHKYLTAMITSQEKMTAEGLPNVFINNNSVKGIFEMTHGVVPESTREACQKLAEAVSSAIRYARQHESIVEAKKAKDQLDNAKSERKYRESRKEWYDEVTLLRSASKARQFFQRVLILLEQGKIEESRIATSDFKQDFNPVEMLQQYEANPQEFQKFRDLFRMYLMQRTGVPKDLSTGNKSGNAVGENISNPESED